VRSTAFDLPAPSDSPGTVSARLTQPTSSKSDTAVVLAHGAGFSMDSPFMADVERGLVERGHPVLAFNYPYRQRALAENKRMLPPDRPEVLLEMHRRALEALAERCPDHRLFLVGKSLGARFATLLAAEEPESGAPTCAGLALLGYPLHTEKRPERLRADHFPRVRVPSLFLQGTRDRLCDLDRLREVLPLLGGPHRLVVIEGADHGFAIPRSLVTQSGTQPAEVLERLLSEVHRELTAEA
jgi:predicted alpha/beta-hydrolase family hydrolase